MLNTDQLTIRRRLLAAGAVGLLSPRLSFADENFPSRPINFICPWPCGGTADQSMRAICTVAGRVLKQAITVDNRAGAAGMVGAKALASARADGYTIGQIPISVTRFHQLNMLPSVERASV